MVLDKGLRVIAANRAFYSSFKVRPEDTQGRLCYTLGDGQWDIPKLRVLLEQIIPEHGVMEGYEVDHEFPDVGHRTMYLNARQVVYKAGAESTIFLGIEDVTERRILEREKDELLRQKEVMLEELQHRVANSLQIIAGIILMKATRVESEETRAHLHELTTASCRLRPCRNSCTHPAPWTHRMMPYLSKLCATLATSMIGDNRQITIKVVGEGGVATSRDAESIGLIATELVINAIKHAFRTEQSDGRIVIAYDVDGTNWKLSVADNGVGRPDGTFAQSRTGLGTGIVKALAQQLGAKVETLADPAGTTVSITHATFWTKENRARVNSQAREVHSGSFAAQRGAQLPLPIARGNAQTPFGQWPNTHQPS